MENEHNRSPTFESLQMDFLSFLSGVLRDFLDTVTRIRSEKLPTMTFQQIVFFFAKKQKSHAVINNTRPQLVC